MSHEPPCDMAYVPGYVTNQRDTPTQSNTEIQSAESRDKSEKVIDSVKKNLVTALLNFGYLDVM